MVHRRKEGITANFNDFRLWLKQILGSESMHRYQLKYGLCPPWRQLSLIEEVGLHLKKHTEWWMYHFKYNGNGQEDILSWHSDAEVSKKLFNIQHAMIHSCSVLLFSEPKSFFIPLSYSKIPSFIYFSQFPVLYLNQYTTAFFCDYLSYHSCIFPVLSLFLFLHYLKSNETVKNNSCHIIKLLGVTKLSIYMK